MRSEIAMDKRNGVVECRRIVLDARRTIAVKLLPATPKTAQTMAPLKMSGPFDKAISRYIVR